MSLFEMFLLIVVVFDTILVLKTGERVFDDKFCFEFCFTKTNSVDGIQKWL
jgi:hypothetical protein